MCELKRLNNIWKQIYPELTLNTEVGFSNILTGGPLLQRFGNMTIKQKNRSWKNTDYLEAFFDIEQHETIGLCLKLNYEHFMIFNYECTENDDNNMWTISQDYAQLWTISHSYAIVLLIP